MVVQRGSCHCGGIAFEVDGEVEGVTECNCSICARRGYLHWIVPRERFRLLTPEGAMTEYRFNTGTARHLFCPVCGVSPFYAPRSHPDAYSVNVRCLDGVDLSALEIASFDGQNWERSIDRFRAETRPKGKR
jgi:hypothetical protein